jgi:hypothetical protein
MIGLFLQSGAVLGFDLDADLIISDENDKIDRARTRSSLRKLVTSNHHQKQGACTCHSRQPGLE